MSSAFQLEKVQVALTPQERFQEFLQSRGRRMTQQRRQIVDEVFSRHEHVNADELCDHLSRSSGSKVSRPTVYRTLTELEEAGLLRKMVSRPPRSLRARLRLPAARPLVLRKVREADRVSQRRGSPHSRRRCPRAPISGFQPSLDHQRLVRRVFPGQKAGRGGWSWCSDRGFRQ